MDNILIKLNKEQLEAVLYNDGPLLVLAGAGTGKTRVLTSKIAYTLQNNLCYSSEILAVTFTNKAANEMKERVANILNFDTNSMWINTFHSIAAKILRIHGELIGIDKNFTIIDQGEQITLIRQILKDLDIDSKENKSICYLEKINKFKENINNPMNSFILPKIKDVYDYYQNRLKTLKLCDFSDLLFYNIRLLQENNEVKKYYNNKFKYILVDEYQDTNLIQNLWLKLISGIDNNDNVKITCVGDDDQSIYGWRGARLENILNFTKDYKNAKILKLERNYRSTQNILSTASELISYNKNRHKKALFADNNIYNNKVNLIKTNDNKQESFYIATKIEKFIKNGLIKSYNNISVLIRAGYQTRIFEDTFLKFGIPYKVIGALKFYDRKEIKDCIAYLRIINNKYDILALERALSNYKGNIGFSTIKKISDYSIEKNMNIVQSIHELCDNNLIKDIIKKELNNFLQLLYNWENKSKTLLLGKLMETILKDSGFMDILKKTNDIESKNRIENIEEFINILNDFKSINEFLEYINLVNVKENDKQNSVSIMTIHSAKGLEFDCVFLPNWIEGTFPSSKSLGDSNGLEEERRLAYVAMTRAKKYLIISYSKLKYEFGDLCGVNKSRFIDELNKNNLDIEDLTFDNNQNIKKYDNGYSNEKYKYYENTKFNDKYNNITAKNYELYNPRINKKCKHKSFGNGVIVREDGDKMVIIFDNYGQKTIHKNFIEII